MEGANALLQLQSRFNSLALDFISMDPSKQSLSDAPTLSALHVFVLANVLRRPIIVYAHGQGNADGTLNLLVSCAPYRSSCVCVVVGGIYLPTLIHRETWESSHPITMSATETVFAALVSVETSTTCVPLFHSVNGRAQPLAMRFYPFGGPGKMGEWRGRTTSWATDADSMEYLSELWSPGKSPIKFSGTLGSRHGRLPTLHLGALEETNMLEQSVRLRESFVSVLRIHAMCFDGKKSDKGKVSSSGTEQAVSAPKTVSPPPVRKPESSPSQSASSSAATKQTTSPKRESIEDPSGPRAVPKDDKPLPITDATPTNEHSGGAKTPTTSSHGKDPADPASKQVQQSNSPVRTTVMEDRQAAARASKNAERIFELYADNKSLSESGFIQLVDDLLSIRDRTPPSVGFAGPPHRQQPSEVAKNLAAAIARLFPLPKNEAVDTIRAAPFKRLVIDEWDTIVLPNDEVLAAGGAGLPSPLAVAEDLTTIVHERQQYAQLRKAADEEAKQGPSLRIPSRRAQFGRTPSGGPSPFARSDGAGIASSSRDQFGKLSSKAKGKRRASRDRSDRPELALFQDMAKMVMQNSNLPYNKRLEAARAFANLAAVQKQSTKPTDFDDV